MGADIKHFTLEQKDDNTYGWPWNEEDRLQIATLLVKAGYSVRIGRQTVPGQEEKKNGQTEYTVEYWEE